MALVLQRVGVVRHCLRLKSETLLQKLSGESKSDYKEITDLTTFVGLLSVDYSVLLSSACS